MYKELSALLRTILYVVWVIVYYTAVWLRNNPRVFALVIVILLVLGISSFGIDYIKAPKPTIKLESPKPDIAVLGEKLFVKGIVTPSDAQVFVNGSQVAENGDGSFTAIVAVPEGKSVLKIEASYKRKNAELLQLVTRQLTPEEQAAMEAEKKNKELAEKQKVLGADQKIEEVNSAYNNGAEISTVKILSHDLKEEAGFKYVVGEVINTSLEDAYWVKLTAVFYDQNNGVLDSKIGFAVSRDEVLKPGATKHFQTQTTTKDFSYYKLSIEWKSNTITEKVDDQEASKSATPTVIPKKTLKR